MAPSRLLSPIYWLPHPAPCTLYPVMPSRRAFLQSAAAASFAATLSSTAQQTQTAAGQARIHQSVCRWCYKQLSVDQLCQ